MIVRLFYLGKLYSVRLPEQVRGQFWIVDHEAESISQKKLMNIDAVDNQWVIKSNSKLQMVTQDNSKSVVLSEGRIYPVKAKNAPDENCYILVERESEDRVKFKKYIVSKDVSVCNLLVGKDEECDIHVANMYVSSSHVLLTYSSMGWTVRDVESVNGTYVNGQRIVGETSLNAGDLIYILGVRMVVGRGFLAINNPDNSVTVHSKYLAPYQAPVIVERETDDEELEAVYYSRAPLVRNRIEPLELTVDMPPAPQNNRKTPIVLAIGPALIMGCASMSTGMISAINNINSGGPISSSIPSMVTSLAMLGGMVVFPIIIKNRDKKMAAEDEAERREKYMKYLQTIRGEINRHAMKQTDILLENLEDVQSTMRGTSFWETKLWSRVIGQPDFLRLRVGLGNVPLFENIKFPDSRFSIDDDCMRDELLALCQEEKLLTNVPVSFSLLEHRVSGVYGEDTQVGAFLNGLILQMAALHSYDEVKLVFVADEKEMDRYNYVRWLPHIWSNDHSTRYLATTPDEVRELSTHIKKLIMDVKERGDDAVINEHYVIVFTSNELAQQCNFLSDILEDKELEGFSVITAYKEMRSLPKECSMIIQLSDGQGLMTNRLRGDVLNVNFVTDRMAESVANEYSKKISTYELDLQRGKFALPAALTFLDMFHVGKIEHLNIANRWKENNPTITLQTEIGVNTDGKTFYLDLHEKAHGPHGLVAGMTGSGKSEFIITYILSMAVNYHPDEVAFILIDYKGGGLAGAFDNEKYRLPHLAGTITNLDGAAINRSLMSIQSELRRRQDIFNRARTGSSEGTIDIYKYQKLYRAGLVKEAVPHLFIISDEFAELKSQQPEFMQQLISTARIGRSLGVHLILATQKPSGVVNDQIWANSKFKVCLKVQDKADSNDMLKRPDAAEIKETGRFYLQVGYNELFEMGQSAWAGAQYEPKESVQTGKEAYVKMLDNLGNVVETEVMKGKSIDGNFGKQIVEVMEYISNLAAEENASAKPLWLPPIPEVITVDATKAKYGYEKKASYQLQALIGEYDDPFNQSQGMLTLPFYERGNLILYGMAGSGKENLLISMLYSLYSDYGPKQLNTYILDFGAQILNMFVNAPQTGEVILPEDEDKLENLFAMITMEIAARKKTFAEFGGTIEGYCKATKQEIPSIVVIINNYVNFIETYERFEEDITTLTRDGAKFGVYFVITTPTSVGIRFKLLQNFGQILTLQMNDKNDYVTVIGNTGGVFPSAIKGRGLFKTERAFEFQTAYPYEDPDLTTDFIKAVCQGLRETYPDCQAKKIPVLPEIARVEDYMGDSVDLSNLVVGVSYNGLTPFTWDFKKQVITRISGYDMDDLKQTAAALERMLSIDTQIETIVVDPERVLLGENHDKSRYIVSNFADETERLFGIIKERNNNYKLNNSKFSDEMDTHPIVCIFVGYASMLEKLEEEPKTRINVALSKLALDYNITVIVVDSNSAATTYSTAEWFTALAKGNGIWIGNGINEQYFMKIDKNKFRINKSIDEFSGYAVKKSVPTLLKVIRVAEEEEE